MTVLPTITWTPSPNFNPGPVKKDLIIIHDIEGSFDSGNSWIDSAKSGVSAHYEVSEDGKRVDQSVKDTDIAWHAGNWDYNVRAIGIEHEGFKDSKKPYPDAMLRVSAALVAGLCRKYGIPADRKHIIAHSEVPYPNDHTDPGAKWPWDIYMSYVRQELLVLDGNINTTPGQPVDAANPLGFSVGAGVLEALRQRGFEAITNEQYFSPNPDQPKGLAQRSFTWAKDAGGRVYIALGVQKVDPQGNPQKEWDVQIVTHV